MRTRTLFNFLMAAIIVSLSYIGINGQVVEKVKDAGSKTKRVTVKTVKKAGEVVSDTADTTKEKAPETAETVKDKTVDGAKTVKNKTVDGAEVVADKSVDGAKATASGAKRIGKHTSNVTEKVVDRSAEAGKYATVVTGDGTKWVSKRVWYATRKTGTAVKEAVVGEDEEKP